MHPTYVILNGVTVNWCMVKWCARNLRRDSSSFTWHQPCNSQTALQSLGWIFKTRCVKLQSFILSRIRLERRHRDNSATVATETCFGHSSRWGVQQEFKSRKKETHYPTQKLSRPKKHTIEQRHHHNWSTSPNTSEHSQNNHASPTHNPGITIHH